MSKENNMVRINRSRYKEIKKMDHNSMERTLDHYYRQGHTDSRKAIKKNIQTALTEIENIKGIGSSRIDEIRRIIHKATESETD